MCSIFVIKYIKMARIIVILIGILATQNVNCAPNDSIDETLKSEHDERKLNDPTYSVIEDNENVYGKKLQGQRQKRWFPAIPYNYPPYAPYDLRSSELENSLANIQFRLQELLNIVKSPPPPPPPSLYPVFVPIYISQAPCSCNPATSDETTTKTPEPTNVNKNPQNETVPTLHDRLPEMEDERQNWGLVFNNTATDYDDDDDGSRPISLTPIITGNDNGRNVPPVEHGSSQADINDPKTLPTIAVNPPRDAPTLENSSQPSVCDSAVLSCCLGPVPTYECIQSRGCQDSSLNENACNPQYMLLVISRLQKAYNINFQ
ncbi:unnamed protein product [Parnassius apollo]|uniref:(apollo) hypothetical protein n=1 Tax=Parnassius apollo TaxID=110799 RepID=A0A8S3X2S7_PARAO|nr:unnamed protein product [Parnassius apollo]